MKILNSAIFKILFAIIFLVSIIGYFSSETVNGYVYDNYLEKLESDIVVKSKEINNILTNIYKLSFLQYAYDQKQYKNNENSFKAMAFKDIMRSFKDYFNYSIYIYDFNSKLVFTNSMNFACKQATQDFIDNRLSFKMTQKCALSKTNFAPWYYTTIVVHDNSNIQEDLSTSRNFIFLLLIAIMIILVFFLSVILYFIFSRPINKIISYLQAIKNGYYNKISVKSSYEFSEVANGINSMIEAITARENTLQEQFKNIKDDEKKLSMILNSQPSIIMMFKNNKVYDVNSRFFDLFSEFKSYGKFVEKHKSIASLMEKRQGYLHATDDKDIIDKINIASKGKTILVYNNKTYIFEVSYSKIDFKGEKFAILVFRDITSEIKHKEQMIKQLWTDSLTNLPNRNKLLNSLEDNSIVYIVNIDRFKQINDFYGYEIGDIVLIELGKMLQGFLSNLNSYFLFKLSADEFVIYKIKANELDYSQSEFFTKKIHEFVSSQYITVANQDIKLSITVGIARTISINKDELLSSADIALKHAKENKKPYTMFSSVQHVKKEYQEHLKWSNILRTAYEKDNLFPVYQPIVCTKTKKIIKYEALIRLRHEGEIYSPYYFLDIASVTRMYSTITKIVFKKSFEFFKHNNVEVSINVSPDEIFDKEIYDYIMELLTLNPDVARRVTIELVETEEIEDFDTVLNFINEVRKFGCKIAIDDFGTGYSNFSYMVKLKADYLKIDGSLIKNIAHDDEAFKLVKGITSLAKGMGMEIIAEFIADKEIYDKIATLDIEYCQGYYFGKPENIANF